MISTGQIGGYVAVGIFRSRPTLNNLESLLSIIVTRRRLASDPGSKVLFRGSAHYSASSLEMLKYARVKALVL